MKIVETGRMVVGGFAGALVGVAAAAVIAFLASIRLFFLPELDSFVFPGFFIGPIVGALLGALVAYPVVHPTDVLPVIPDLEYPSGEHPDGTAHGIVVFERDPPLTGAKEVSVLSVLAALSLIGFSAWVVYGVWSGEKTGWWFVVLAGAAILALGSGRAAFVFTSDMRDGPNRQVKGLASISTEEVDGEMGSFTRIHLQVGGQHFQINDEIRDRIRNGNGLIVDYYPSGSIARIRRTIYPDRDHNFQDD